MRNIALIVFILTTLVLGISQIYENNKPYDGYLLKNEIHRFEINQEVVPNCSAKEDLMLIDSLLSDDTFTGFEKYFSVYSDSILKGHIKDSLRADYLRNYFKINFEICILDTIKLATDIKWLIVLKKSNKNPIPSSKYGQASVDFETYAIVLENPICYGHKIKLAQCLNIISESSFVHDTYSVVLSDLTLVTISKEYIISDVVGVLPNIRTTKTYFNFAFGCPNVFKESSLYHD